MKVIARIDDDTDDIEMHVSKVVEREGVTVVLTASHGQKLFVKMTTEQAYDFATEIAAAAVVQLEQAS